MSIDVVLSQYKRFHKRGVGLKKWAFNEGLEEYIETQIQTTCGWKCPEATILKNLILQKYCFYTSLAIALQGQMTHQISF